MEVDISPSAVATEVAGTVLDAELEKIAAVREHQPKIDALVARHVRAALETARINAAEFCRLEDIEAGRSMLRSVGVPAAKLWWIQLLARIAEQYPADPVQQPSIDALREALPFYEIELLLIERVGNRLVELIQSDGTTAIVQTLFQDDIMSRWYTQSVTFDVFNRLSRESLRWLLTKQPSQLRVLEVGAGTGGLTSCLLDLFPADRTTFLFTDVGTFFLRAARRRFAEYPFIEYGRLDLEQPYDAQGFAPGSFDLVIANNVIHDTKNVAFTLGSLAKTLVPGGMMLMIELTDPQIWWHMCFGSLEGWWRFKTDPHDAREDLMLLKREQWIDLLGETGFSETAVISDCLPYDFANRLFLSQTPRS